MELMTLGDAIYKAQKVYYLANGTYTTLLDDLDVSIDRQKFELHMYNNKAGNVLTINRKKNGYIQYVIYYSPIKRQCKATITAPSVYKDVCHNLTGKEPVKSIDNVYYVAQF